MYTNSMNPLETVSYYALVKELKRRSETDKNICVNKNNDEYIIKIKKSEVDI